MIQRSAFWVLTFVLNFSFFTFAQSGPDHFVDESVSGVVMANPQSSLQIIGKNILDKKQTLKPLTVFNSSGSEKLELTTQPGDEKYSFSEFHLKNANPGQAPAFRLKNIPRFVTAKGIRLNMTVKQLESRLGKSTSVQNEKNKTVLIYEISHPEESEFLAKMNMPGYFAKYTFMKNRLIEAHWGLSSP